MDRTMYKERIVIHYNWGHLKSLPNGGSLWDGGLHHIVSITADSG